MSRGPAPKDPHSRFWAKVNKSGDCWTWTAAKDRHGYGLFYLNRRMASAHRVSYGWISGPIPEGMQIDHRCHNRACVNPAHLRVVTSKQNSENLRGAHSDSWTGALGVGWDSKSKKYRVLVHHSGLAYHGGRYAGIQEAAEAAKQLRLSLFTHNDVDRKVS